MTVHNYWSDDDTRYSCTKDYTAQDFSLNYHIFSLIWDNQKIQWFVDGNLMRTDYHFYSSLGQEIGCYLYSETLYLQNIVYPQNPMNTILNFAIQSGYDQFGNNDSPDETTTFPSSLLVDWVRYYQRFPDDDILIESASELILDNEIYNVLYGNTVTFNCEYVLLDGQQLDINGKNQIIFGPGFKGRDYQTE